MQILFCFHLEKIARKESAQRTRTTLLLFPPCFCPLSLVLFLPMREEFQTVTFLFISCIFRYPDIVEKELESNGFNQSCVIKKKKKR